MIYLSESLKAWGTAAFNTVLKEELCTIDAKQLPLQEGLTQSNYAISTHLSIRIINASSDKKHIRVKAGLFYTGVISGCNCADDPTPVDEINEYCDVLLCINKTTAETSINLIN